jgi:hypothetical protein
VPTRVSRLLILIYATYDVCRAIVIWPQDLQYLSIPFAVRSTGLVRVGGGRVASMFLIFSAARMYLLRLSVLLVVESQLSFRSKWTFITCIV